MIVCISQKTTIHQQMHLYITTKKMLAKKIIFVDKSAYAKVVVVLITDNNNTYIGYSFKAPYNVGFCAETSAIAQMLINNETKIKKLIALHNDKTLISPCGKCREQLYHLDHKNLNCEIKLEDKIVTLSQLLPEL